MKNTFIKYEWLITGPEGTRSGQVFAQSRQEAEQQVKLYLKEGETIYSLTIARR